MVKITENSKTITFKQVTYICDGCEKELDTVQEYDDGYIPESKYAFDTKYHFNNKWFHFNKCLCPECKAKFIADVEAILEQLGFSTQ